jgi:hypothetical protein
MDPSLGPKPSEARAARGRPPRLLYWPRSVRGPFFKIAPDGSRDGRNPSMATRNPGDGCDIAQIVLAKNACFER